MREITPGYTAEISAEVTADKLASAVGSGSLDVFATPMMAALMEQAACAAVAPFLEEGETTVGTELSIRHTAATPQGMTVTAKAELVSANGRELVLNVSASDSVGEIGSGTHKRFVVYAERFQKKTEERGK